MVQVGVDRPHAIQERAFPHGTQGPLVRSVPARQGRHARCAKKAPVSRSMFPRSAAQGSGELAAAKSDSLAWSPNASPRLACASAKSGLSSSARRKQATALSSFPWSSSTLPRLLWAAA